jgi:hypothetical protein
MVDHFEKLPARWKPLEKPSYYGELAWRRLLEDIAKGQELDNEWIKESRSYQLAYEAGGPDAVQLMGKWWDGWTGEDESEGDNDGD